MHCPAAQALHRRFEQAVPFQAGPQAGDGVRSRCPAHEGEAAAFEMARCHASTWYIFDSLIVAGSDCFPCLRESKCPRV
eukprot:2893261-Pyramimonas_sp.AAC.1